jgi:hypothetical protein
MGLISQATDTAAASGVKVVTSVAGTAYSLSSFPLSSVATVLTIGLTVVYLYGAMPRVWRTTVALKRGLFNKDWSLWQSLGNQPIQKED